MAVYGNDDKTSGWWTEEVVSNFLEGVRAAIPGAEMQFAVMEKVVKRWVPHPSLMLDLGCGDGALGRFLLDCFPGAGVVFTDFSDPMLNALRSRLGQNPRAIIAAADFSTPAWRDSLASFPSFDVVVSGFAIHHQPDSRKKVLYGEIHDLLAPGGVFLNLEHVASVSPAGKDMFDELFIDSLFRFHHASQPDRTREEIATTYYNRPDKVENILAPVELQCNWLREMGFEEVDCFFKIFELALFGGRKSSR